LVLTAWSGFAEVPGPDPLALVQGDWGFALADDMTCANNPVRITPQDGRLVFEWPKSVAYSDGTVDDGVIFTVTRVAGLTLSLRRDDDGVPAMITPAADGTRFHYSEADPEAGSTFDRCAAASS
jgi:hypothetical protein